MNANIRKLHRIASKKSRLIIGLMSGTSLDGLDIALCRIQGAGLATSVKLIHFETVSYERSVKSRIRRVFARQQIQLVDLCELNPWMANLHADMILKGLKKWKVRPEQIDVIASHGQTVFHAPKAITAGVEIDSTLQIGDGDHVAVKTGIITISDFRQKHIAAGGEGAPLAMYGDHLLFHKPNELRVLLNIGGIGNFTFLPGKGSQPLVTDTGPGNTLLDQWVQNHFPGQDFDRNSAIARRGTVHQKLLRELKKHNYFKRKFPKTTGPELFNLSYVAEAQSKSNTRALSPEDVLATLTRFSAETIAEAIAHLTSKKRFRLYASGGGAHNPLLMRWIQELLPLGTFYPMSALGISGDAKEAVLFAVLANESLVGGKVRYSKNPKVPSVTFGKVSFPS